jgi:hypothetical protein
VAGLYLLLAVAATWPLAAQAGDSVFGLGTPPLNVWAIGWVLRQLPREPWHLFDANCFYPYPRSLAFSEHLFVPSLLAAPWAFATGNLVLAHNAVALLTLALAGLGMYLLCRDLTGDGVAAFGGGILYAFHTWNLNELIRLQILSNAWFPFLLLALLRFFRAPSARSAVAAGASYAAQSLSGMYWALYLPLVTAPVILVLARRHPGPWRARLPLVASLGGALAVTALFALPYVQNGREFGLYREAPAPIPVDRYLDVLPGNLLYADVLGTARPNENAAHFLGFSAVALALFGLWRPGARPDGLAGWRGLVLLFVGAGFLLSLGPRITMGPWDLLPGPYAALYEFVPGFRHVRYPERFALVLVLGLAPLVAEGLARLRAGAGPGLALAACGLLFVEHLSVPLALEPLPPPARMPEVYRWLATQDDVRVVAEVPSTHYWMERSDAAPMYFSTVHWKETPQGFTGYFPPVTNFVRWRLFHFPDPESVEFLRKFGVDTVVVSTADGPLPAWAHESADWSFIGPFPEGDGVLRLRRAGPLLYQPPGSEAAAGLEPIDAATWRVFASHPHPGRARDGRPETAWTTGDSARAGDYYRVRFPEPTTLARISLGVRPPFEFPTRLELLGRTPDGTTLSVPYDARVAYDALFSSLLYRPREASLDFDVQTPPLIELRLRIPADDPFQLPWTMAELRLYRPAAVPRSTDAQGAAPFSAARAASRTFMLGSESRRPRSASRKPAWGTTTAACVACRTASSRCSAVRPAMAAKCRRSIIWRRTGTAAGSRRRASPRAAFQRTSSTGSFTAVASAACASSPEREPRACTAAFRTPASSLRASATSVGTAAGSPIAPSAQTA